MISLQIGLSPMITLIVMTSCPTLHDYHVRESYAGGITQVSAQAESMDVLKDCGLPAANLG